MSAQAQHDTSTSASLEALRVDVDASLAISEVQLRAWREMRQRLDLLIKEHSDVVRERDALLTENEALRTQLVDAEQLRERCAALLSRLHRLESGA